MWCSLSGGKALGSVRISSSAITIDRVSRGQGGDQSVRREPDRGRRFSRCDFSGLCQFQDVGLHTGLCAGESIVDRNGDRDRALFAVGAVGKSAQIPLYTWLPDAMEGPTPVSALIHAATMVTAGVYMIVRNHAIYDMAPMAMTTVAWVGGVTALFAATIGLVQTDIKRVLAYSTVSQLGYMFLACGIGAYTAAIFHLMTHAFFKALLFLSAGSVIHALSGEQDIRKMGGLKDKIPWTHRPVSDRHARHRRDLPAVGILEQG